MRLRVSLFVLLTAAVSAQSPRASDGLVAALARGDMREVERALDGGADANAVTPDGTPAIMLATLHGDVRLVQRYFESGFPFGRHQWISAAGTSWATLAIAHTLPDAVPGQRASR